MAGPAAKAGARSLIYLRKRDEVKTSAFRRFLTDELLPALVKTGALRELRTQVFMPWIERLWDTPNVAHDNPTDQRFHASVIRGFTDTNALRAFFGSGEVATRSGRLPEFVSAVHAYEVTDALTYVRTAKSSRTIRRSPARRKHHGGLTAQWIERRPPDQALAVDRRSRSARALGLV